MPIEKAAPLFLFLVIGAGPGYLAYLLAKRFERIAVETLTPLCFLAYLALFGIAKSCLDKMGGKAWIGIFFCVALWVMALVLRESTHGLAARISFFGAALLFTPVTWIVGMPATTIAGFLLIRLIPNFDADAAFLAYTFSAVTSVFAVPLWEHLFRLAMSMRHESD